MWIWAGRKEEARTVMQPSETAHGSSVTEVGARRRALVTRWIGDDWFPVLWGKG